MPVDGCMWSAGTGGLTTADEVCGLSPGLRLFEGEKITVVGTDGSSVGDRNAQARLVNRGISVGVKTAFGLM